MDLAKFKSLIRFNWRQGSTMNFDMRSAEGRRAGQASQGNQAFRIIHSANFGIR